MILIMSLTFSLQNEEIYTQIRQKKLHNMNFVVSMDDGPRKWLPHLSNGMRKLQKNKMQFWFTFMIEIFYLSTMPKCLVFDFAFKKVSFQM